MITNQRAAMSALIMMAVGRDLLPIDVLSELFNSVADAITHNELENDDEDDLTVSLHSMLDNLSAEEKVQAANLISNTFFGCAAPDPLDGTTSSEQEKPKRPRKPCAEA